MASVVKLKPEHLDIIIDVLEDIVKWKSSTLSIRAWSKFETEYLPSIVEQITANEFKINHASRNTPNWFTDQVRHSRVLNSSNNPRTAVHLFDTLKGQRAIKIMRAAARGQAYYDAEFTTTTFTQLFN